jgi:hypothetical protein
MRRAAVPLLLLANVFWIVPSNENLVLADGGVVRAMEVSNGIVITAFTSPAAATAGEIDLSVLIQDAQTRAPILTAEVDIAVVPREQPNLAERHVATRQQATNQLMHACHLTLTSGWHEVEVLVSEQKRHGNVCFAMYVPPARSKAGSFWPWFAWPIIPVALILVNLTYRNLRSRHSAIIDRSGVADLNSS